MGPGKFQILDVNVGLWVWNSHDSKRKVNAVLNFIEGQYQKVQMESMRIMLFVDIAFQFSCMVVLYFSLQSQKNYIPFCFQRYCILESRVWHFPLLGQRSGASTKFQGSLFPLLITWISLNKVPGPKKEEGRNANLLGLRLDPERRDNTEEISKTIWDNELD